VVEAAGRFRTDFKEVRFFAIITGEIGEEGEKIKTSENDETPSFLF
jgi:hypothetical protein